MTLKLFHNRIAIKNSRSFCVHRISQIELESKLVMFHKFIAILGAGMILAGCAAAVAPVQVHITPTSYGGGAEIIIVSQVESITVQKVTVNHNTEVCTVNL